MFRPAPDPTTPSQGCIHTVGGFAELMPSPTRATLTRWRRAVSPELTATRYAHRGFAQSAQELVKEVEPELSAVRGRLPGYRCVVGEPGVGSSHSLMTPIFGRVQYTCLVKRR